MKDKEEISSENDLELSEFGQMLFKHRNTIVNIVIITSIFILLLILYMRIDVLTTHPCKLCEQYLNCLPNSTTCIPKGFLR